MQNPLERRALSRAFAVCFCSQKYVNNSACMFPVILRTVQTMKLAMKTAQVIDHVATGLAAREAREARSLPLSIVADRISVSRHYLCDLEAGRRNWTQERLDAFTKAIRRNA